MGSGTESTFANGRADRAARLHERLSPVGALHHTGRTKLVRMRLIEVSASGASMAVVPLSELHRLRLVFPAEAIVHRSRGIDRSEVMPTRTYHTAQGVWKTDDVNLMRLLHNDFDFLIRRAAKPSPEGNFIAGSTNFGSNPYYCIRHSLPADSPSELFYLEQEELGEEHSGILFDQYGGSTRLDPLRVAFAAKIDSRIKVADQHVPDSALVFTAPAIVWNGRFVGWERYARETYDCRHVVALQYLGLGRTDPDQERVRSEVQRLQQCWAERDRYVSELLQAAETVGYAVYERLMLGVGGLNGQRYVALWSGKGTAAEVADRMIEELPSLEVALQITEGGGTAIVTGGGSADWRVLGSSSYRRGRSLCCLLLELTAPST